MSYTNLSCLFLKRGNNKLLLQRYLFAAVLYFITTSCLYLSGSIITSNDRDGKAVKLIKEKGLDIESIIVNKSFDSETVKGNADYAFNIILGSGRANANQALKTFAVFKEESFVKGFDQLNTISLEITVKDENDSILKTVLISEESENTLSSYKYLFKIIKKGIKETGL